MKSKTTAPVLATAEQRADLLYHVELIEREDGHNRFAQPYRRRLQDPDLTESEALGLMADANRYLFEVVGLV